MSKIPNFTSCAKQEQTKGCGVACIATVLQTDYWSVARVFETKLSEEGIDGQTIMDLLSGYGFDQITKAVNYYGNGYEIISERILKPFADIHIIAGHQFIESTRGKTGTAGHWMIMNKNGRIFCPSTGKKPTATYLVFDLNIGIFYPKSWKFNKLYTK